MADGPIVPPDKYARVYYKIVHDSRFETIYPDDRHLAAWLRLLISADASWPNYPPLPRTIRKASLDALVASGLVELMPQDCYRIHGLDRERNTRARKARDAAAKRWDSVSNADALPEHSVSNADALPEHSVSNADALPEHSVSNADALLAEQSRAEQEQSTVGAEQTRGPRLPTPRRRVLSWLAEHGAGPPVGWENQKLNELVRINGADAVIGAFESAPEGPKTCRQFVRWAEQSLNPDPVPRNGTKPGKYLEHDGKDLADAFVRD